MDTNTTTTAPTFTLCISAYGGWTWDQAEGSHTRVTFEGPAADARAAAYIATHGHLALWAAEDNEWDAFPLAADALDPQCEHGLSRSLCAGPGHYPADH